MDAIFESLSGTFAAHESARETLRERRDQADVIVRSAQKASTEVNTNENLENAVSSASQILITVGSHILNIEKALPEQPGAFHRYYDIWRNQLQTCASVAVFLDFIVSDTLADEQKVKTMVGADIRLPTEDYLVGVCNAVSELARLSMNRVIMGDFDTPRRCAKFANDVFEAFKQLNLRNDFLRKRYDGMKYDVKKMEEIMYDLSIRGLMKKKDPNSAEKESKMEES